MSKSYRIRTQVGVDKNIQVDLNQDFDLLEILSLKLRQTDIFDKNCADYGVVAGRVSVNNGYGIPNARVSIFIALDDIDATDPVISTLYPYRDLSIRNEDGYRYNLLPYEPSYPGHVATGSFPSMQDVLTRSEVIEVYDKYYKFTTKTNESGDFMIVGIPLGNTTIHMDVDLSDIGCFSLTPADLIRMGIATESQFDGNKFRSSENLDSLPQIVSLTKQISVEPFWGNPETCTIGIARCDFNLSDSSSGAGIVIEPHSVFIGSIMSSDEKDFIKSRQYNKPCKIKPKTGDLCTTQTSPGRILSIRQTEGIDENGDPILEEFTLVNQGRVINEDGSWVVDVPMNLNYVTTNEFGEQVLSDDPDVGIPTEGKYRFKVQYDLNRDLTKNILRADFLVPNIREYGWDADGNNDPANNNGLNEDFQKSYAFSLNWDDYVDKNVAINCEDYFYNMYYNKVYTVSNLIDQYKASNANNKFLGIKNILNDECSSDINKFPTNDGHKKNDLLVLLLRFILAILYFPMILLIIIGHIICAVIGLFCIIICLINKITQSNLLSFLNIPPIEFNLCNGDGCNYQCPFAFGLPSITYPDCNTCECSSSPGDAAPSFVTFVETSSDEGNSPLINLNASSFYEYGGTEMETVYEQISNRYFNNYECEIDNDPMFNVNPVGTGETFKEILSALSSGQDRFKHDARNPNPALGGTSNNNDQAYQSILWTDTITLAQKLNNFHSKANYFGNDAPSRIKTTINPDLGSDSFEDNVMMLLLDNPNSYSQGDVISFQSAELSNDPNIGTTFQTKGVGVHNMNIPYANPSVQGQNLTASVKINVESNEKTIQTPTDIEYGQVIYTTTVGDLIDIAFSPNTTPQNNNNLAKNYLLHRQKLYVKAFTNEHGEYNQPHERGCRCNIQEFEFTPLRLNENFRDIAVAFVVRGVDPNADNQTIEYDISRLLGYSDYGFDTVVGSFKPNYPIISEPSVTINYNNGNTATTSACVPHVTGTTPTNDITSTFKESFIFDTDSLNENFIGFETILPYQYIDLDHNVSYGGSNPTITTTDDTLTNGSILAFKSDHTGTFPLTKGDFLGSNSNQEAWDFLMRDNPYSGVDSTGTVAGGRAGENTINIPSSTYMPYGRGTQKQTGYGVNSWRNASFDTTNPWFRNGFYTPRYGNFRNQQSYATSHGDLVANVQGVGYSVCSRKQAMWFQSDLNGGIVGSINFPQDIYDEFADSDNNNSCRMNDPMVIPRVGHFRYMSHTFLQWYNQGMISAMNYSNTSGLVMRSDRLPSSSIIQGSQFESPVTISSSYMGGEFTVGFNHFALYLNSNFPILRFGNTITGEEITSEGVTDNIYQEAESVDSAGETGDYEDTQDEFGDTSWEPFNEVMATFQCEGMVEFDCYDVNPDGTIVVLEDGEQSSLNERACSRDAVTNGCYQLFDEFMKIGEDIQNYTEWNRRFPLMFAICRGVMSMDFVNNWINGVLYMPPFQKDTFYDSDNQPFYNYCSNLIMYQTQNNSFIYRSSPFVPQDIPEGGIFIGRPQNTKNNGNPYKGSNERQLGSPTTIMDLGPRDEFTKFICFNDNFEGYNMDKHKTTTFNPLEDLINLFVISRLLNFGRGGGRNGGLINQYFSRDDRRIDGDFTQLASQNSEYGIKPILTTNYEYDAFRFRTYDDEKRLFMLAITMTGDTESRKVISPGELPYVTFGYPESQYVPFYRWRRDIGPDNSGYVTDTYFGTELNNWYTKSFISRRYQDLTFENASSWYYNPELGDGLLARYDEEGNPQFELTDEPSGVNPVYLMSSPFHFYFGPKVGNSSLDLFIRKYGT